MECASESRRWKIALAQASQQKAKKDHLALSHARPVCCCRDAVISDMIIGTSSRQKCKERPHGKTARKAEDCLDHVDENHGARVMNVVAKTCTIAILQLDEYSSL